MQNIPSEHIPSTLWTHSEKGREIKNNKVKIKKMKWLCKINTSQIYHITQMDMRKKHQS